VEGRTTFGILRLLHGPLFKLLENSISDRKIFFVALNHDSLVYARTYQEDESVVLLEPLDKGSLLNASVNSTAILNAFKIDCILVLTY